MKLSFSCFLACVYLFAVSVAFGQTPPPVSPNATPFISEVTPPSLPPSSTSPGNGNFTLTILGANFTPNVVVNLTVFGSTTFHPSTTTVNPTGSQITAQFTSTTFSPGTMAISVTNPSGSPSTTSNTFYMPDSPAQPSVVLNETINSSLSGAPMGIVAAPLGSTSSLAFAVVSQNTDTVSLEFNYGNGQFFAGPAYPTGAQPWGIVAADFFGSGQLGLAITNSFDNTVSILLPNGGGTYRPGNLISLPNYFPTQIVAGDFNGDGKIDLAVLNTCGAGAACYPRAAPQLPGNVTILLGNGDGTFTVSPTVLTAGNIPYAMVAADFNGDGILDLVVANSKDNTVSIFMGNGDGTFTQTTASPATGQIPMGMVVGDFNSDGNLDLAVTNANDNTVSILLNQNCPSVAPAACTFAPAPVAPSVPGNPRAIATADLNADGHLDLVVSSVGGSSVTVLLGDGTGAFPQQNSLNFPTGTAPIGIALGDFNQDGRLDIVTSNNFGSYTYLQQAEVAQLSLTTSNPFPAYGQFVSYTANLIPSSGQYSPTGSITFMDGSTPLGTFSLNGYQAYAQTGTLGAGTHQITAVYNGDHNFATVTSNAVTETVSQAQTSISLSSNVTNAPYNLPVTFTAKITANLPVTGTVTFFDYQTSSNVGTATPVNNQAQLTLSNLSVGPHFIVANYSGDSNFVASSSGPVSPTIAQDSTTLSLSANPNPASIGQSVSLTASIQSSPSGGSATGTVSFYDSGTLLQAASVASNAAQISVGNFAVGGHVLTATYSGDTNFAGSSSSSVPLNVTAAPTTTIVTSSLNPSAYGQAVTYTVAVKLSSSGSAASGQVTLYDGSTALSTGTLSSGSVQFTLTNSLAGAHSITAQYAGTPNYQASTSPVLTQTINAAPSTLVVGGGPNPSSSGQSVTITATLQSPYNLISTGGTITFFNGATQLGSGTVPANGQVSISTSAIPVGAQTITAKYAGDSNLQASNASFTQTVNPAASTTTLSLSNSNPTFGQSVTFTATVAGTFGNTPTGTVKFVDGATTLGTAPLSGSTAQFSTTTLSIGSHSISAQYSGDTNSASSVSGIAGLTVAPPATTTVLTSSVNPSSYNQSNTVTATIQSSASGTPTGTVTFYDNSNLIGSGTLSGGSAQLSISGFQMGTHALTATYSGDSNFAGSTATAYNQVVNVGPTVSTITSSANPSIFGYNVNITVTVSPTYGGSPTGLVTLYDGTTSLGSASVSTQNGLTTAVFPISNFTAGTHSLTAQYNGNSFFAASTSAALTQTVNLPVTTTTLAASSSSASYGQTVALVATVQSSGSGTATGTVTFLDGATTLGTVTLSGNTAQLNVSTLALGAHSITAKYSGDSNNAGSTSSPVGVTINQAAITAILTTLSTSIPYGQSVSLTATLAPPYGGSVTGTVTFYDGATSLGSQSVANNSAQLSVSSFSVGQHSLTFKYSGDANFLAATSSVYTQTITQAGTTIAVTSNANPLYYNQPVTFIAVIAPAFGGSATGTVTFYDGANSLGSANVASNAAQISLASLAIGSHTISAKYNGDANFFASTSPTLGQTVSQANTTTIVGSNLNPSSYGQSVTFTASITPAFGGSPTGSVTFYDNGTQIGTSSVSGNVARFTTAATALAAGSHSISTLYSGDANFSASSSNTLAQSVTPAATSTALSSSLNPSIVGNSVTFTATVSSAAGSTSGTVNFYLDGGSTPVQSSTLSGGAASYTTNALTSGTHTLTASFVSSNSNFQGSSSPTLTQNVSDFSVSDSPSTLTISRSHSGTSTLTITPIGGFTGNVSLSCSGAPSHVSCGVSPSQVSLNGSSASQATVTVTVQSSATLATHTLTLKAVSGSLTRTVTLNVTVTR